jgi:hypothetical protein
VALVSTLGGTTSNSYVTLADATAYFVDRLDSSAWSDASIRQQQNALIMATMRLEAETYVGSKAYYTQRLQWPRYSTFDRDGIVYDYLTIPGIVQQATCELALALLREPALYESSGLEQFVNVKLGSIDVTPRAGTPTVELPAIVKRLLAPVLLGGYSVRVVRA